MAAYDKVFLDLPETETFNVFRIEKFEVVPWKDIGAFYTGDSYIVLNAYKVGRSERVSRDIYFWLGTESTTDEIGTAAIKSVELDNRFDGEPTQHREVQGHESAGFLKLFDKYGGIRYLAGGIESGFRKASADPSTMLFQIKGKKTPILQQVLASGDSLNQGDAFILVTATKLYLWLGKKANHMEKNKAAQSFDLFKSRFPKIPYERLDFGETSAEFWEALGGEVPIKSESEGGSDAEHETSNVLKIYQYNGPSQFELVAEKAAANKECLASGKTFVVQRGDSIVVYFGQGISMEEQKNGIKIGLDFLTTNNLPNYTAIGTAREGRPSDALDILFA